MSTPETAILGEAAGFQPVQFDARHTATLQVNAFRMAQGSAALHVEILRYVAANFREQLDPEVVLASVGTATAIALRVHHNARTHQQPEGGMSSLQRIEDEENDRETVADFAEILHGYLGADSEISARRVAIDAITKSVIGEDYDHLRLASDSAGRNRKPVAKMTPFNDPHLSFWVYYGLLSATTELPEYDAMFSDIVTAFHEAEGYDDEYRGKSQALIDHYAQHHPEHAEQLSRLDSMSAMLV